MLELPHAVVGAVLAAKIGNPALAVPFAIASHFALDLIPHWNPHLNTELKKHGRLTHKTTFFIVLDVAAALVTTILLASYFSPDTRMVTLILLGALMGILPDLVEAPYFFFGIKIPYVDKLLAFQKSIQNDAHPIIGLSTQVLVLLAAFWWILN